MLADDPALTDRSGLVGPGGRARRRHLLRVVLDSRLRMPLDSQLVRSASGDVLVVCDRQAEAEALRCWRRRAWRWRGLPGERGGSIWVRCWMCWGSGRF